MSKKERILLAIQSRVATEIAADDHSATDLLEFADHAIASQAVLTIRNAHAKGVENYRALAARGAHGFLRFVF